MAKAGITPQDDLYLDHVDAGHELWKDIPEETPVIERFTTELNPSEAKRAWMYCCYKGLKDLKFPASCETWNDIYKSCRTLMNMSVRLKKE